MKKVKVTVVVAAALAAVLILAGCGGSKSAGGSGDAKEITVVGTEFHFEPSDLTVDQGEQVKIVFKNEGTTAHVLEIPDFNVNTGEVPAGESKTVEFTADKDGSHDIVCTVAGHADSGMKGTLTVNKK